MIKRILALSIFIVSFLIHGTASAHENFWYDQNLKLDAIKTVAILPVEVEDSSENSFFESYIETKLAKDFHDIRFLAATDEKFFTKFDDEKTRASNVKFLYNVEYYLVPQIFINVLQEDQSPETLIYAPMKSWTEIEAGSNFSVRDEKFWTERHIIPARMVNLQMFQIGFTLYDLNGNAVLTFAGQDQSYDKHSEQMFREIMDRFSSELQYARSGKIQSAFSNRVEIKLNVRKDFSLQDKMKSKKKSKASKNLEPPTFKIKIQPVESEVDDDKFFNRAADMLFKNSFRDMKNVSIVDEKSDYEIRCKIIDSSMEFTWQKPYITTNETLIKTENDQNDQNEIKNYYQTEIEDHFGKFDWVSNVTAKFELIDSKTGLKIMDYTETNSGDKDIDVFQEMTMDFLNQITKFLGVMK